MRSRPSRSKFETILRFARAKISTGHWGVGDKVPSENELCAQFAVSRMTARRALEQLALDGLLIRRRGAGSYIADQGVRSSFLSIRSISQEVAESGRAYRARVLTHRAVPATEALSYALELKKGAQVFHSLIAHLADQEAVQLEYRYVRPDAVPRYLATDFSRETPNEYLQRLCPLTDARQEISAAMPTPKECRILAIDDGEPCLLITRTTAARIGLVSFARILAPASRYRLAGELHFTGRISNDAGRAGLPPRLPTIQKGIRI